MTGQHAPTTAELLATVESHKAEVQLWIDRSSSLSGITDLRHVILRDLCEATALMLSRFAAIEAANQ